MGLCPCCSPVSQGRRFALHFSIHSGLPLKVHIQRVCVSWRCEGAGPGTAKKRKLGPDHFHLLPLFSSSLSQYPAADCSSAHLSTNTCHECARRCWWGRGPQHLRNVEASSSQRLEPCQSQPPPEGFEQPVRKEPPVSRKTFLSRAPAGQVVRKLMGDSCLTHSQVRKCGGLGTLIC